MTPRHDSTASVVDISPGSRWERLMTMLAAELDGIVERAVKRTQALASCRTADERVVRLALATVARSAMRRPEAPADDVRADLDAWRAGGEALAAQGVTPEDALEAWRILRAELQRSAEHCVPHARGRERILLSFLEAMMMWADHGMFAAAKRHRELVDAARERQQPNLPDLVRAALRGTCDPQTFAQSAAAAGVTPSPAWYAVRARTHAAATLSTVRRFLGGDTGGGAVALLEADAAGFVAQQPRGVAPCAIGIAGPVALEDLPAAYAAATRALETALALGARGVFDLRGLGLHAAVLADGDVGDALVARYLGPFEAQGAAGASVIRTVERYLANDSRLEVTADELGVHVNTVRYRLTRFEELTACSLRDTEALTEVWWALQRRRLVRPTSAGATPA
jgi:hypothetical protein